MAKDKSTGSIKRFGTRYGRTVKKKFGIIEKEQRRLHECPYCNYKNVKRVSLGIWKCSKCGATFTGKAYSIKKEIITRKSTQEKLKAEAEVTAKETEEEEKEEEDEEEETYSDSEE